MPHKETAWAATLAAILLSVGAVFLAEGRAGIAGEASLASATLPTLRTPPGGRSPAQVPQFIAITFDDNFGLAYPGAVGGVRAIVDYYAGKHNPRGSGNAADFDGAPIKATFFSTSVYMVDAAETVPGGGRGEDEGGRNLTAWKAAAAAGHEIADHTVHHFNGGVAVGDGDCCRPRDWSADEWSEEIDACRRMLTQARFRLGAKNVSGFRAPYLAFNDNMFTALARLGFAYDSSVPNCLGDDEDGSNCSWPYVLDHGSPDADVLERKLASEHTGGSVHVGAHPGLWELPVTTLIVPPDSAAGKYGFTPGLRQRIAARAPLPYPGLYEPSTGKIAGLDYTLLIDEGLTSEEMRAVLAYNLDLHLAGNRAPLIFVAHPHLYAFSTAEDNPDTPSEAVRAARWKALTGFINYALTKPDVRIVGTSDVLAWVQATLAAKR